ncbi:MAG: metal-binding protein [Clostridia bacterium]|nr:metal-binding protein [Clostridia bacterium]
MKQSAKFFSNKECEYYPCHEGIEEVNCLFCYCPLYRFEECLGNPSYIERDGKRIKCCTECTFPHKAEHYDQIMEYLKTKG